MSLADHTAAEAVRLYLAHRQNRVADETVRGEKNALNKMLKDAVLEDLPVSRVTAEQVSAMFYGRGGWFDTSANSTVSMRRSILVRFWAHAQKVNWTTRDVMADVGPVRPYVKTKMRLSAEELLRMLDLAEYPRDRMAIAMAMNTAHRAGELTSIRLGDLNLPEHEIRVIVSKSRKEVLTPVTADLFRELNTYLDWYAGEMGVARAGLKDDWFLLPACYMAGFDHFTRRLKPGIRWNQLHRMVGALLRKMGLPTRGQGIHTIRHSVARLMLDQQSAQGYDAALLTVSAMLNHAKIETTQRYVGMDRERSKLNEVLKGKSFITAMAGVTPLRNEASA